jgi:hypothetical protein
MKWNLTSGEDYNITTSTASLYLQLSLHYPFAIFNKKFYSVSSHIHTISSIQKLQIHITTMDLEL